MTLTMLLYISVAVLASVAYLLAILYKPMARRFEVLGITRPVEKIQNLHGEGLQVIPNTFACEDLHHHIPSGLLFGVAETDKESREKWFPPMDRFDKPDSIGQGSIFTLNPTTKETTHLALTNFTIPFVTHGIDIYSPPTDANSVYIFAVNHLPNPAYHPHQTPETPKARSQIEIFHHTLNTRTATHLRSIQHPLIRTPNDLYITNEKSFYLTNDHRHREGASRLYYEDLAWRPWSDVVHISIHNLSSDPTAAITATIALDKTQNPNGLAHGATPSEILLARASAGLMPILHASPDHKLHIDSTISLPNTIDNPSYFHDPYPSYPSANNPKPYQKSDLNSSSSGTNDDDDDDDASGYVLAGLTRAIDFPAKAPWHPVSVWLINRRSGTRRLVFQDDGRVCDTASTAVIVGIEPKEDLGDRKKKKKKQAWLFVTGPLSEGVVRTRIDL